MIENVLKRKNITLKAKITVKMLISALIIALAVAFPQLIHLVAGASGGVKWLPMYLPVLLGGCLLGPWWGLGVGIASPLVSFAVTSAFGNAMPAAARLPFMMAELAVFATVAGVFSDKIMKNAWIAFPAVLIAQVSGRAFFLITVALFQRITSLSPAVVWSQIQTGFAAIIAQALIVPFIVMGLRALLIGDKE